MVDYLALAKAITRTAFPTHSQARAMNAGRPACQVCHVPIAWDRESMCATCIKEEFSQRFTVQKKELL